MTCAARLDRISFVLATGLACSVEAPVADDVGHESTSAPAGTDGSSSSSTTDEPAEDTSTHASTAVDDTSTDDTGGAADEGPKLDVASDETGTTIDQCDEDEPDLIHVLTIDDEIWTFDPIEVQFQLFTSVVCPEVDQISGFAIDRDGRITLLSYEPALNGPGGEQTMRLSQMNAGDASCDVLFEGPIAEGSVSIDCADIALVASDDDPGHELLYASRCTGGGFTVAPNAGSIWRTELADAEPVFDLLAENNYTSVPVAGTGDGRLFGVSGEQDTPGSTVILEFDPSSGALIGTTPVPEIDVGEAGAYFALAFYGGDLYTFGLEESGTLIYRYDWDDDDGNGEPDVQEVIAPDDAPFPNGIFAAASPTCIPLGPAG